MEDDDFFYFCFTILLPSIEMTAGVVAPLTAV
jgi:hypothetical protein